MKVKSVTEPTTFIILKRSIYQEDKMIENIYTCNKSPRVHEAKRWNGKLPQAARSKISSSPPPKKKKTIAVDTDSLSSQPFVDRGHAGYSGPAELHADGVPPTSGLLFPQRIVS